MFLHGNFHKGICSPKLKKRKEEEKKSNNKKKKKKERKKEKQTANKISEEDSSHDKNNTKSKTPIEDRKCFIDEYRDTTELTRQRKRRRRRIWGAGAKRKYQFWGVIGSRGGAGNPF